MLKAPCVIRKKDVQLVIVHALILLHPFLPVFFVTWVVNLLLDVLVCSISVHQGFHSLSVFCLTLWVHQSTA